MNVPFPTKIFFPQSQRNGGSMWTEGSHEPKSFRKQSSRSSNPSGEDAFSACRIFWQASRNSKASTGAVSKCPPKIRRKYASRSIIGYSATPSSSVVWQLGDAGFSVHSSDVPEPLEPEPEQAESATAKAMEEKNAIRPNFVFISSIIDFSMEFFKFQTKKSRREAGLFLKQGEITSSRPWTSWPWP